MKTTGLGARRLGRRLCALVVALGLAAGPFGLAGCQEADKGISVVDNAGREIKLDRAPRKVVSMAPSNTEILYALGLGDRVVGVTTYCNYPPEAANVAKVGDAYSPDYEKIVSLEPDLVLAVGTADSQIVKGLESYGLKVFVLQAATVDAVPGTIELVGQVMGVRAKGKEVADALRERIAAVKRRIPEAQADRPSVFWVLDSDLWTVGPSSFVGDLISAAGGVNIAADKLGTEYGQLSLEYILETDPEVIVIPVLDPSVPAALEKLVGWDTLTAVKNGRVYQIDPDVVSRPGPRIAEALEEVAGLFYPDVFGQ